MRPPKAASRVEVQAARRVPYFSPVRPSPAQTEQEGEVKFRLCASLSSHAFRRAARSAALPVYVGHAGGGSNSDPCVGQLAGCLFLSWTDQHRAGPRRHAASPNGPKKSLQSCLKHSKVWDDCSYHSARLKAMAPPLRHGTVDLRHHGEKSSAETVLG